MKNLGEINVALRRKNRKNYTLLVLCNFVSVLLITAYVSIMRSPTVLMILPEGGDSRKQAVMIFALAVVGCGAFSTYAASLFFRYKSHETGIFMALGASRKQICKQLFRELFAISIGSCAAGALLGTPLAWCVWQLFRLFVVDTQEMTLSFDPHAYLIAALSSLYTIVSLVIMGTRFVKRTNIIDIVNEQRKSEPIRDVKPLFGPIGIVLIIAGGFGGYMAPHAYMKLFSAYPPAWINIFYLPLIIGLYMVLLHTIIRGWRRGKSRYKNIITRSMMKFQGRQTVNNMLVITVLIAGAYFAAFYTPMTSSGMLQIIDQRPVDYAFRYREDQNMLTQSDIEKMASEKGVAITDWRDADTAILGQDGKSEVDDGNGKFHYEYNKLSSEGNYISESNYNKMTGQNVNIEPGKFALVLSDETSGSDMDQDFTSLLTNMTTQKTLSVSFQKNLHYNMMASSNFIHYFVLNDADYATITESLKDEWYEKMVYFNVKNVMQTYDFSKELYNSIIDHSGPECEIPEYYDRIGKITANGAGEAYWGDTSSLSKINYNDRGTSQFKQSWKYAPQFRVLDKNDLISTYAVYLMLFVFISVICFAAVLVIGYTRCLTIALNNRQVYDDLRHLGATPKYLYHAVRGQISKVFGIPGFIGTLLMFVFYVMILYFNDNSITSSEATGLRSCLYVMIGMSTVIWGFYRVTLHKVCGMLNVKSFKEIATEINAG